MFRESALRRVAIVAPHFPPSNLASVHRARLWAQHLQEFGWEPIIVTTHWKYYEEDLDWELNELVSPELQVIRTSALPTKPLRFLGEIGLRSLWWHYKAIAGLAASRSIDFLHITVPSHFSAVLGELVWQHQRIPFGIDYIDPWVHEWPGTEVFLSKAWTSCKLGQLLEPWAVKNAKLITGVASAYFEEVLERNSELGAKVVTCAMPYGSSSQDFSFVEKGRHAPFLFDTSDGLLHVVYAGAVLPRAHAVLDRFMQALAYLREIDSAIFLKLRVHFIGTGNSMSDSSGNGLLTYVRRYNLLGTVEEHPNRIGYVDVLRHLAHSAAVLVLGSSEPHYTPSKIFQAIQSNRPVFALLHESSAALTVLRESRAGKGICLTEKWLPPASQIANELRELLIESRNVHIEINWSAIEPYSARNSSLMLARSLERALTVCD